MENYAEDIDWHQAYNWLSYTLYEQLKAQFEELAEHNMKTEQYSKHLKAIKKTLKDSSVLGVIPIINSPAGTMRIFKNLITYYHYYSRHRLYAIGYDKNRFQVEWYKSGDIRVVLKYGSLRFNRKFKYGKFNIDDITSKLAQMPVDDPFRIVIEAYLNGTLDQKKAYIIQTHELI